MARRPQGHRHGGRRIGDLERTLSYKLAWICLYRGLASDDADARQAALTEAVSLAQPFATGDPSSGVKFWSLLICGRACRAMGQYDRAAECLAEAGSERADAMTREEAAFETARNAIEQAGGQGQAGRSLQDRFAAASAETDKYDKLVAQAAAEDRDSMTWKAVLLRHALLTSQAAAAGPEQAKTLDSQAQKVLADFALKHREWATRAEVLEAAVSRYASRSDWDALNSFVLLSLAAQPQGAGDEPASVPASGPAAERRRLLEIVLGRSDDLSLQLAPQATWQLGLSLAQSDPIAAAERFTEIAARFPDNPLARSAALNAAASYNAAVVALAEKGKTVPADVRRKFIATIETLLARWGSGSDVAEWQFDLAWQYQKLAEATAAGAERDALQDKALSAYEAVPAEGEHRMEARRRALEIRYLALSRAGVEPSAGQQAAESLVKALWAFGAETSAAAAKAGPGRGPTSFAPGGPGRSLSPPRSSMTR